MPRIYWPFALAMTLMIGLGVNHVVEAIADWHLHDMHVYRDAALRLREGGPLYGGDVTPLNAYRYAPWFAYAWVPLTYLPEQVVKIGWSVLLLAGTYLCVRPLLRLDMPHVATFVFFAPILFAISSGGNIQPVMIAALYGLSRKWGWVAVGLAGSLKVVPLAYCAVFIAQRRWWSVVGAVTLTLVLWAPVLWMPVDPVTLDAGRASVLGWPWLGTLAAGAALYLAARSSEWTGLASGVAGLLALPRFFVYELALLLVSVNRVELHPRQVRSSDRTDARGVDPDIKFELVTRGEG